MSLFLFAATPASGTNALQQILESIRNTYNMVNYMDIKLSCQPIMAAYIVIYDIEAPFSKRFPATSGTMPSADRPPGDR
jgi:hypothetical protein